jgi:hypothetical protein
MPAGRPDHPTGNIRSLIAEPVHVRAPDASSSVGSVDISIETCISARSESGTSSSTSGSAEAANTPRGTANISANAVASVIGTGTSTCTTGSSSAAVAFSPGTGEAIKSSNSDTSRGSSPGSSSSPCSIGSGDDDVDSSDDEDGDPIDSPSQALPLLPHADGSQRKQDKVEAWSPIKPSCIFQQADSCRSFFSSAPFCGFNEQYETSKLWSTWLSNNLSCVRCALVAMRGVLVRHFFRSCVVPAITRSGTQCCRCLGEHDKAAETLQALRKEVASEQEKLARLREQVSACEREQVQRQFATAAATATTTQTDSHAGMTTCEAACQHESLPLTSAEEPDTAAGQSNSYSSSDDDSYGRCSSASGGSTSRNGVHPLVDDLHDDDYPLFSHVLLCLDKMALRLLERSSAHVLVRLFFVRVAAVA